MFSLSKIDNEQSMVWMPVLFHKDNIISFLLGEREGMKRVGVGGGVSKMCKRCGMMSDKQNSS